MRPVDRRRRLFSTGWKSMCEVEGQGMEKYMAEQTLTI